MKIENKIVNPPDVDRDQGVQALEGDVVGDDRLAYWLGVLG